MRRLPKLLFLLATVSLATACTTDDGSGSADAGAGGASG